MYIFHYIIAIQTINRSLTLLYEGGGEPGGKTGSNLENQQYFENCSIFRSKNQLKCGTSGLE